MRRDNLRGILMLITASAIGGMGFIGSKFLLNYGYGSLSVIAGRFIVATAVLSIVFHKSFSVKPDGDEIKAGVLMGALLFGLFFMFTTGLRYTTPSVNAFLTNCQSIFVPFAAWFVLRRKPDKYAFIGAFMTVIGIGLLSLNDKMEFNLGALLSVLASVSFSFQVIATDKFSKKFDPIRLTIIENFTVAALAVAAAVVSGSGKPMPDLNCMLVFLGIGIGCTAIYFLFQTMAQRYASPTGAAVILSSEAVVTAIASAIIFKEVFSLSMVAGCVLIFVAIIVTETKLEFLFNSKTVDLRKEI